MTVFSLDVKALFAPQLQRGSSIFAGLCVVITFGGCDLPKLFDKKPHGVTYATPSGKALPRWEMLKSDKANARLAPSADSPVLFTYKQRNLPLQVISETREFRLVCDPSGRAVWLHATLLRASNQVINRGPERLSLLKAPKPEAHVWAYLKVNSLATVIGCEKGWCRLHADHEKGWVAENKLWGRQTKAVCTPVSPLTGPIAPLRASK